MKLFLTLFHLLFNVIISYFIQKKIEPDFVNISYYVNCIKTTKEELANVDIDIKEQNNLMNKFLIEKLGSNVKESWFIGYKKDKKNDAGNRENNCVLDQRKTSFFEDFFQV